MFIRAVCIDEIVFDYYECMNFELLCETDICTTTIFL